MLAWLNAEPGAEAIDALLQAGAPCLVPAAIHAEIIAKALAHGVAPDAVRDIVASIGYTVIDTSAEDGAAAGWMRPVTRAHGLSLGDRLCLAAAQRLKAQVHTADRAWLAVADALQLDICCIRPDEN
ncbi:MAG: PIN domain-containing protein [Proteobacteria bacterium]|nr:PIN domain-containing protein [Pseudomonadota bacterium]